MSLLGERQVVVDCDVIQADGGTQLRRSAGDIWRFTMRSLDVQQGLIASHPLHSTCAAISVGIVDGVPVLDLPYVEDSGRGRYERRDARPAGVGGQARFVEVQGTAEGMAFTRSELDSMLVLAESARLDC